MAIPPGEEYNGYEKLILPFDGWTWFWIAFTFGVVSGTVALAKTNAIVKNFVLGKFVSTPILNITRAFFGVSQIQTPFRNFARYVLMMVIIFSLIIRTAYQGVMFEFLQKEMRKPIPTSIDNLIEQNYTFYVERPYKGAFNETEFVQK